MRVFNRCWPMLLIASWLAAVPASAQVLKISAPEPQTLLSLVDTNMVVRNISGKITEGLLRYDEQFRIQPLLAESWEVDDSGTRYRFRLRQGVRWHDGQPFGAEDVQYSLLALREYNPRGRVTLANLDRVEVIDAHQIDVHLLRPTPYFLRALSSAESPIVPAHLYAGSNPLQNPYNRKPVGTGPFVFEGWSPGRHLQLKRNPDYWRSGTPHLQAIHYKFTSDSQVVAVDLETGNTDFGAVSPHELQRLRKLPHLAEDSRVDGYLNNMLTLEFNLAHAALGRREVRQAIAHGLDRAFLNRFVFLGQAEPLDSPVPKRLQALYADDLPQYPFDLALANRLLDQAGVPRDAKGVRFNVRLSYYPGSASFKAAAEYVRAALGQLGIRASVETVDLAYYVKKIYDDRAFDINLNGVGALYDPTVGVQRHYLDQRPGLRVPFYNASGYANAQVQGLLQAAANEADPEQRARLFKHFQHQVMQDLPLIPLVGLKTTVVYNKALKQMYNSIDLTAGDLADAYFESTRGPAGEQ